MRPSQLHAQPPQQQQLVLHGSCYEEVVDQLAEHVIGAAEEHRQKHPGSKFLVGIAGAPGSGKSTLAQLLCSRVNALLDETASNNANTSASSSASPSSPQAAAAAAAAAVVPMDGFHYYKRQLDAMPNPSEAYARRGAHWTFDAAAFVDCVRRIRQEGSALVPSFDHGVGDVSLWCLSFLGREGEGGELLFRRCGGIRKAARNQRLQDHRQP